MIFAGVPGNPGNDCWVLLEHIVGVVVSMLIAGFERNKAQLILSFLRE